MVITHCEEYRRALTCRESYAKIPCMRKLDETMEHLHRCYKYSAKKTSSLKEDQTAFFQQDTSDYQASKT